MAQRGLLRGMVRQLLDRIAKSVMRTRYPTPEKRAGAKDTARPPYPGDYTGIPKTSYAPHPDGVADPGEVVWAYVPFEDDPKRGKDRPVLVIGRAGDYLLALPMTSKDHDRDLEQEAAEGRHWIDLGTGTWDKQGRASEARVDRILQIDPTTVRREGGRISHRLFDTVVAEMRARRR